MGFERVAPVRYFSDVDSWPWFFLRLHDCYLVKSDSLIMWHVRDLFVCTSGKSQVRPCVCGTRSAPVQVWSDWRFWLLIESIVNVKLWCKRVGLYVNFRIWFSDEVLRTTIGVGFSDRMMRISCFFAFIFFVWYVRYHFGRRRHVWRRHSSQCACHRRLRRWTSLRFRAIFVKRRAFIVVLCRRNCVVNVSIGVAIVWAVIEQQFWL